MHATTPVNVKQLKSELMNHPDKHFVDYLCNGLQYGFDTMVKYDNIKTMECRNNLSARSQKDTVADLINKELLNGFVYGPFEKLPFDDYRVSPLGVAEGKYSFKKRLILDLSAPHNDTNVSINDLIDKDLCSMTYVKIDDAIRLITNYGKGTKLCKFDIQNEFKICPVLPNQWPLFCFKWESLYYFYVRLSFGCRSSPKIFDNISTAICFIAEHNYKVKHILHLLDDFLTVDPPEFDAERTMALMTMIFNRLNVPLAANKTMGPLTCIEYLGIVLDTDKLEARLPANKVERICKFIISIIQKSTCTKRELLQLLGHLNFASRVIVPDGKIPPPRSTCREAATQLPECLRSNVVLNETVKQLWTHAVANTTRSLYNIGFSHFVRFLLLNGITYNSHDLPLISEDVLIYFIAHCFKVLKLKHTTIKIYLCGIRHAYLKSGYHNPLETPHGEFLPRLTLILKSVKRIQGSQTRTRLPITFPILQEICLRIRKGVFGKYIDCLIETTCIVAFFAFLRCGEFTVTNVDKFDPLTSLCISDIILKTDYAILRLKESKTDPFRKGIDIKLFKIDNSICPFLALKRFLSIRHSEFGIGFPSDPLFITVNREALTRQFFLVKLKNILELCGYDPNLYNGHSFRSGAATSAGKARVEDHMIKVLGRWKSDSYCRYIKISPTSIKYARQSLTES
ncbi:unnamed protein product [Mytilus edulis]|uniref:Uncharacterized protein n=1 Tax=Mytilus edulis TaxID=6550 RepID=A0A8S3TPZ0_MYTED|nr:unnamed protein product [Mytilus edulis]